ncbi:MAG: hypothetical protein ACRD9S_18590 [Pyrinomonadaceae bacterium]
MAPKNAFSVSQAFLYHLIPNWEEIVDPNNPLHQIGVHSAIHEMANAISDRGARTAIQSAAKKAIASIAAKNAG